MKYKDIRNNNTITIKYDSSNHISQVIGASGKKLIFSYSSGRISKISDPIGRTLEYTYDAFGNLTQVKGTGGGITKYNYDQNGLISITDENGKKFITNEYDTDKRVIRQINESGNEAQYIYDDVNNDNSYVQLSSGIATRYRYNDMLYITRENYYDGTYKEYSYDSYGNRTSIKDENGNITRNTYDLRGNITSMTDALDNTVTYSYDSNDDLTGVSTLSGSQNTLSYDENSNLLQVTTKIESQTNAKTLYTYDSYGRLLSVTDAEGNLTTFQFDGGSQPISATDTEGNITKYGYDALDRRTSITNADGTTTFTYKVPLKKENGTIYYQITRYTYDKTGKLLTEKTSQEYITLTGEPTVWNTISYTYDKNGNAKTVSDSSGGQIEYTYDSMGRVVQDKTLMEGSKYIINYIWVKRIDGVYHARQDVLQQYGGYNFLYDIVFDYATSMKTEHFDFTYNGQDYRFWAWKGDYLNLGAGAELGLYKRLSTYGIPTPHWLVDTSLALPMTLTLLDNRGNQIASYHPSEPQWWITAFNPYRQNVNAKDLRVTYTIDFSGNKKSRGMFKAFCKRWYRQTSRLTFDKKKYKVTYIF